MKGINKVILIGRLGQAPDIRTTNTGLQVVAISLATNSSYKDKDGNTKDNTEWHRVVSFGKLAEIVGKYATKGSMAYVEGSLKTRKYLHNNVEKNITEIVATSVQMLDSKSKTIETQGNVAQAELSILHITDDEIPF